MAKKATSKKTTKKKTTIKDEKSLIEDMKKLALQAPSDVDNTDKPNKKKEEEKVVNEHSENVVGDVVESVVEVKEEKIEQPKEDIEIPEDGPKPVMYWFD